MSFCSEYWIWFLSEELTMKRILPLSLCLLWHSVTVPCAHVSQISRGWRQSEVLNKNFKGKPYLDNLRRRGLSRTHCKDTQKRNGLSYFGESHSFAQEKPNPLLPIYLYKCKHKAHADWKAYFKVAKEMRGCESKLQQLFPSLPEIIPLPADTLFSAYRQVFSFQQYTKAHHNRSDCP